MTKRSSRSWSSDTIKRIALGQVSVKDFFDDQEIDDLLAVAKTRIVDVFINEHTLHRRGKPRRTDNYIVNVSGRQSDLARYVTMHICRNFVEKQMLSGVGRIPSKYWDVLLHRLQYELILMQLNMMCSAPLYQVYYEEQACVWQIIQSAVDERFETNKHIDKLKVDDRSFHGKVRSQVLLRGLPPGSSIGIAR